MPCFVPDLHERVVCSGEVEEDEQEGVIVLSAVATDADDSVNNRKVDYSILSGNHNDTFQINSINGAIYLVGPLDRELTPVYRLEIQVRACAYAWLHVVAVNQCVLNLLFSMIWVNTI